MIIYPAIDLRGGKVVRLTEGDPNRQTTFSDDPVATAERWIESDAAWIHVVNLDGAFDAENDNLRVLERITALGVPVQFGGGLRNMAQIENALNIGASRVVLGTVAVKQPEIVAQSIARFGADAVCVGLDARDGQIATHGWQQTTGMTPVEFGAKMAEFGAKHALYTDVARDGKLSGVDVDGTARINEMTGLNVIASGGVRDLDDIRALKATQQIAGVVVGMALYTGKIDLKQAIAIANGDV